MCIRDRSYSLKKIREDKNVRGIVLTSSNDKFFSIGLDIPHLFELTKKDFKIFYKAYNQVCIDLYTLLKPTIAAITGHAIAGGCVLALCCDYLLSAGILMRLVNNSKKQLKNLYLILKPIKFRRIKTFMKY